MIQLRKTLGLGFASISLVFASGYAPANAQATYPDRPVRLIVPFSPGGGTDIVTRMFGQKFGEVSGQTFIVENKAGGAAGSVGSREIINARPDGYTLGVNTSSGLANAAMDPGGFNPLHDLAPVGRLGSTTMVVAVNTELPVNSVDELVAYAKANPGMSYGSSGVGSIIHYTTAAFANSAGLEMTHVPYRGEQPALNDVVGGVVPMIFASVAATKPFIEAGRLRPLAVTSPKRFPTFPDLPTMTELGYKDVAADVVYGLYTTKESPPEAIEAMAAILNQVRADPAASAQLLEQLNFNIEGSDTPAQFKQYMEQEFARFQKLAEALNLVGTKDK